MTTRIGSIVHGKLGLVRLGELSQEAPGATGTGTGNYRRTNQRTHNLLQPITIPGALGGDRQSHQVLQAEFAKSHQSQLSTDCLATVRIS